MITPSGDVRLAEPLLWFGGTPHAWDEQQAAVSDLRRLLPDMPVLLSARFRNAQLEDRIAWLRTNGHAFAVEPYGESCDAEPSKSAGWLKSERPWLVPPTPRSSDYEKWMLTSLRHQDSLQPALLMTPSPTINPTGGASQIEELSDAAHNATRQLASQVSCLIGFSGSREWLRNKENLQSLGNVLVDSRLAGVFLRISHRENVVRDRDHLSGLRELIIGLSEAGYLVFLANSGRLGWLSLGWGSWSISAGITLTSWSERERSPMNQPAQPSQWYYEHQLGMEVRWRHHQQLVTLREYEWCSCQHCQVLRNGYDPNFARRHALYRLAGDVSRLRQASGVAARADRIKRQLLEMKLFRDIVWRRLGTGWEGYELDFIDRWLEVA